MTQYIKFAGDSLKRLEEEEVTINNEQLNKKKVDFTRNYSMAWEQIFHDTVILIIADGQIVV